MSPQPSNLIKFGACYLRRISGSLLLEAFQRFFGDTRHLKKFKIKPFQINYLLLYDTLSMMGPFLRTCARETVAELRLSGGPTVAMVASRSPLSGLVQPTINPPTRAHLAEALRQRIPADAASAESEVIIIKSSIMNFYSHYGQSGLDFSLSLPLKVRGGRTLCMDFAKVQIIILVTKNLSCVIISFFFRFPSFGVGASMCEIISPLDVRDAQ